MRSVDVRVGHDDDLVVTQLAGVEVLPDPGAQRHDDRFELLVLQDFVPAGPFHIHHLAPERQDGLEMPIAALFGRAAGRVTLHDINFGKGRIG